VIAYVTDIVACCIGTGHSARLPSLVLGDTRIDSTVDWTCDTACGGYVRTTGLDESTSRTRVRNGSNPAAASRQREAL